MESYDPNYIKAQNRKLVFDLFMAKENFQELRLQEKPQ